MCIDALYQQITIDVICKVIYPWSMMDYITFKESAAVSVVGIVQNNIDYVRGYRALGSTDKNNARQSEWEEYTDNNNETSKTWEVRIWCAVPSQLPHCMPYTDTKTKL